MEEITTFKIGDVVTLKSGSPEMTVASVGSKISLWYYDYSQAAFQEIEIAAQILTKVK